MKQKSELAVIDFTKFDIQQLPELKGKKEEIKKVIKENPIVKVTDNASYELAKKSRTAVKTLRTSLEKEKKEVNDRIKKNVLEVVANEYDSLITDVKNDENARQKEVTAWEEKKEQERLEKVRLEQERVNGIKKSIHDFRENNEKFIASCVFESIEATKTVFEKNVSEFDRTSLAEYEVLFDDTVAYLDNLLEARIATLTEQENIRLAKIELEKEQEKQRLEAERIAEEQRIERERIEAEQKRIAEEQRIAQEKFLKEKREFEEKQAEAKFQERVKILLEIGLVRDDENKGFKILNKETQLFFDWQISSFDDNNFETSLSWFIKQMSTVENNESAKEERQFDSEPLATSSESIIGNRISIGDYHEDDVDPKGIKTENVWVSTAEIFNELREVESEETNLADYTVTVWQNDNSVKVELSFLAEDFVKFSHLTVKEILQKEFDVPTRKQQ